MASKFKWDVFFSSVFKMLGWVVGFALVATAYIWAMGVYSAWIRTVTDSGAVGFVLLIAPIVVAFICWLSYVFASGDDEEPVLEVTVDIDDEDKTG